MITKTQYATGETKLRIAEIKCHAFYTNQDFRCLIFVQIKNWVSNFYANQDFWVPKSLGLGCGCLNFCADQEF